MLSNYKEEPIVYPTDHTITFTCTECGSATEILIDVLEIILVEDILICTCGAILGTGTWLDMLL